MIKKRNMHPIDQVFRILLGITLIYIGFFSQGLISDPLLGAMLGVFGLVNIVSGLIGVCPVYLMAGISTLRKATPSL